MCCMDKDSTHFLQEVLHDYLLFGVPDVMHYLINNIVFKQSGNV